MRPFFLLFLLLRFFAYAQDDEKAFYAVSSLYFYLEDATTASSNENKIIFKESDIDNLWAIAGNSSFYDQIDLARMHYHNKLLKESKDILDGIWNKRDSIFYNTYATRHDNIDKFLLPTDHQAKPYLDQFFERPQILSSQFGFKSAGFFIISDRPSSLIVAKHPFFSRYVVKTFLKTSEKSHDQMWENLINRCKGADNLRNLIALKHLRHFSVPQKWIYIARGQESWPILVASDMELFNSKESKLAWQTVITPNHLRELYCLLSHGYASTRLHHNIPYAHNGKFACIDTEHPQRHLRYDNVKVYLSDEMKSFWDKLVSSGGNV